MSGSHRARENRPDRRLAGMVARRVLGAADERAERHAVRDADDRAAGRAERVPAPRLAPRRPRSSGPRWYTTTRGQLIGGGGAVVLAVLLRVLVPSGSDEPHTPLGEGLPHFGADWTAAHGWKYRISVTPLSSLSSRASEDGCVRAPKDGFVNARFGVRVQNLSGKEAPVPRVDFAANLDASGAPDPTMVAMPRDRANVSVLPKADGARCTSASSLGPDGRSRMKEGQALDLVGVIGGISIPVQGGLSVIVRYHDRTGGTLLLAPFPAFPIGS